MDDIILEKMGLRESNGGRKRKRFALQEIEYVKENPDRLTLDQLCAKFGVSHNRISRLRPRYRSQDEYYRRSRDVADMRLQRAAVCPKCSPTYLRTRGAEGTPVLVRFEYDAQGYTWEVCKCGYRKRVNELR